MFWTILEYVVLGLLAIAGIGVLALIVFITILMNSSDNPFR